MTNKVEVFWRNGCGFCARVMDLFDSKNIAYTKYNIWQDDANKQELEKRLPNFKTVPQVFINGKHIGGCDDTVKLDQNNELDNLIAK